MNDEHDHNHDESSGCGCENGGPCTCGGDCQCNQGGCGDGCGCGGHEVDGLAMLVHKAKMKLLLEKLKDELEKTHGADMQALAKMMVELATQEQQSKEATAKKRDELNEKFDKLFG